jgi:hypothetical protein
VWPALGILTTKTTKEHKNKQVAIEDKLLNAVQEGEGLQFHVWLALGIQTTNTTKEHKNKQVAIDDQLVDAHETYIRNTCWHTFLFHNAMTFCIVTFMDVPLIGSFICVTAETPAMRLTNSLSTSTKTSAGKLYGRAPFSFDTAGDVCLYQFGTSRHCF